MKQRGRGLKEEAENPVPQVSKRSNASVFFSLTSGVLKNCMYVNTRLLFVHVSVCSYFMHVICDFSR